MGSDRALFECTQCGACCKGYGGTYLESTDIARIAEFIGVSGSEFEQRYCVISGNRPVLAQQANGYCIFFEHNCIIHAVKPRMCRQWPYIQSLLVDIANWRMMASVCPGMCIKLDDEHLRTAIRKEMNRSSTST